MGGLIATRGTRRLVKHYNDIFDKNSIADTKKKIMESSALLPLFENPAGSGSRPIYDITNSDDTGLFLPADDQVNHPNLLKRWNYYLSTELEPTNQELLRGYIAAVLNFPSGKTGPLGKNRAGNKYARIHFDCVQAAPGQKQTVVQSDEYKLKGGNDDDDTGLLKSTAYSLIILMTDPISQYAPDPLDPQNYQ